MKLLITGACGFIGSKVSSVLCNEASVTTIDNCRTGYVSNMPRNVRLIRGNCQDPDIIMQLENENFDAILHIAGQSSGEISFEDPIYDLQTNTQSTLMLLDYALKNRCNTFIYASTMSVYGDGHIAPVLEGDSLNPSSFYAIGKIASEQYLKLYSSYGLRTISLRLFNVYGPGQNMKNMKQGMLSIYLSQLVNNGKIVVKGSPQRFRDFVHIKDVTNAFHKALSIEEEGYSCFNIGSGNKKSINEIIEMMKVITEKNFPVEYTAGTPGDMHGIVANIEKANNELNWQPNIDFEIGFTEFINWGFKKE